MCQLPPPQPPGLLQHQHEHVGQIGNRGFVTFGNSGSLFLLPLLRAYGWACFPACSQFLYKRNREAVYL